MKVFFGRILVQFFFVVSVMLVVAAPTPIRAAGTPGERELTQLLQNEFPPYWTISNAEFRELDSGSENRSIYAFDLTVKAEEPLFGPVNEVGPFLLVLKTLEQGANVTVSGVLDLSRSGNEWKHGADLSTDLADFGRPLDRFDKPVVDLESPRADEVIALVNDSGIASRIEDLTASRDAELAQLKTEAAQALDAERARIATELEAERQKGAAAILSIIAEHAAKRGSLIAQQNSEIAELETGLASQRLSLQRQVESATDIARLQQALLAQLTSISKGEETALATFDERRQKKIEWLQALPTSWHGQVFCTDADGEGPYTSRIEMELGAPLAGGFAANLWTNRGKFDAPTAAEIKVVNDVLAFPLELYVVAPRLGRGQVVAPDHFTLELAADGRMSGVAKVNSRIGGAEKEITCAIALSS